MAGLIISQVLAFLFTVVLLALFGFEPGGVSAAIVIGAVLAVAVVWWFGRDSSDRQDK
jgi:Na+-driven multidrug efflux pump